MRRRPKPGTGKQIQVDARTVTTHFLSPSAWASVPSQTGLAVQRSLQGGRPTPVGGQRGRAEPPGQVWARRRERAVGRGRGEVRSPPLRPPLSPAAPPRFAMVERGDAAPLLRWAEGPAVSPPQAPELQAGGRGWGAGGRGAAEPPRRREPEELGASEVLLQPGRLELGDVEEDQVVAVFVVTFDPRSGESLSETRGRGGGSPRNRAWGAAGEGLAARAPAPTHLHPHPAAGSGGGSGTSPAGCPLEFGRGTRGFVPGALRPPLLSIRQRLSSWQPARPSSRWCLCCSSSVSCLWLLFSCLAGLTGFFPPVKSRAAPQGNSWNRVSMLPALAPHLSLMVTLQAANFPFSDLIILRNECRRH